MSNNRQRCTKKSKFLLFFISGLFWLLASSSINTLSAEECYQHLIYDYDTGRAGNYPVCRAFAKNLNRFCDEPIPLYRTLIAPGIPKLRMPKWTPVEDWHQYFGAVTAVKKTVPGELTYNRLERALSSSNVKMWIGKLNLDNYGPIETVIRLNGRVPKGGLYNLLILLNPKTKKFDKSFERISRRPYDAFIYDGMTFLMSEKNWHDQSLDYEIYIYEPHHAGTRPGASGPVCVFAYKPSKSTPNLMHMEKQTIQLYRMSYIKTLEQIKSNVITNIENYFVTI